MNASHSAGSAYDRRPAEAVEALTRVGRGTPMGELLRRYWHPVGLLSDATEVPRTIRILSEDLILFRTTAGQPGLLYPRCAHRGASLYYGRVEQSGIRCCYHGWLFGPRGECLEQPCEPGGGRALGVFRQPWYPLEERYGLLFAYLGPPAHRPVLPRYDVLENIANGEWIEADDSSIGGGGPTIIPCNWLQHFENVMDPFHVPILHGSFSGLQFTAQMGVLPVVEFQQTARGVLSTQRRQLEDGKLFRRVTEAVLPTIRVVPSPRVGTYQAAESVGWVLPIDDTHFRIYVAGRVRESGALARMKSTFNGRRWNELTEAEHQRYPGDYEAQVSQGPITLHSEEHLVSSDRGIALLRRLLATQIECVAKGEHPLNTAFNESDSLVKLVAGNYLESAPAD